MEVIWNDEQKEKMNIKKKNDVTYLTYPSFDALPQVIHGFSTRLGGVSKGEYASMNLSFVRGDREEDVRENYSRLSHAIGFEPEDIVTSDQTHTTNVRVVKEEDRGSGIIKPRKYKDVDGMVTDVPGLVLATFYADCVPLFFVDPIHKAVGLSHSGWRGTAGKIGAVTIEKMKETYGSLPEEMYGAIGPSICQKCYEVSGDVVDAFQDAFEKKYWNSLFYKKENGKYQLNLWEANRRIMLDAGMREEHISMPNICTCCNPDFLFSHRASKGRRGNLGAFLGIRK